MPRNHKVLGLLLCCEFIGRSICSLLYFDCFHGTMETHLAFPEKTISKERRAVNRYQWLEALHAKHHATLLRLAQNRLRRYTGSIDAAEDVIQDVFELALRKDIRDVENPLGWLIKATQNLCMQRYDRTGRDAELEQRFIQNKLDQSTDRSVYAVEREESETDVLLWMILLEQMLSPDDWELLRKYCLEGVPMEAIAKEMNEPVNRLYVRIHRIRKKLEKISPDM